MKRIFLSLVLFFALIAQALNSTATADVLFESGTLGPTGVTWTDLTSG